MLYDSELLYTIKTDYSPHWGFHEHAHSYWQLMYVMKGRRNYIVDGVVIPAEENDCILFKPGQRHSLQSGTEKLLVADVKFLIYNEEVRQLLMSFDTLIHCGDKHVLYQLELMLGFLQMGISEAPGEIYAKQFDRNEQRTLSRESDEAMVVDACLNTILLQMIRMHYMSKVTAAVKNEEYQSQFDGKIGNLVDRYIRAKYMEPLSLSDIALHLGYNKNYLCQEFKQQTGKSIFEHVYDVRLDMSQRLLKLSDHTLESIAEKTGFASVNHFNRSFKKKYGITPGKYRKKAAASLWAPVLIDKCNISMEEMYGGNLSISREKQPF